MPKPAILFIRGAFAPPDQYDGFRGLLPQADVAFADLPHLPSLWAYADHFSALVRSIDAPCIVCGVSFGGVVALGLDAPNLVSVLALDPPMRVPVNSPLRARFAPSLGLSRETDAFLSAAFGIEPGRSVERDHFPVMSGLMVRAYVLAGDVPTDPSALPTLLSQDDFDDLRTHPLITAKRVRGVGHDIALGGASIIRQALEGLAAIPMLAQAR